MGVRTPFTIGKSFRLAVLLTKTIDLIAALKAALMKDGPSRPVLRIQDPRRTTGGIERRRIKEVVRELHFILCRQNVMEVSHQIRHVLAQVIATLRKTRLHEMPQILQRAARPIELSLSGAMKNPRVEPVKLTG